MTSRMQETNLIKNECTYSQRIKNTQNINQDTPFTRKKTSKQRRNDKRKKTKINR